MTTGKDVWSWNAKLSKARTVSSSANWLSDDFYTGSFISLSQTLKNFRMLVQLFFHIQILLLIFKFIASAKLSNNFFSSFFDDFLFFFDFFNVERAIYASSVRTVPEKAR